MAAYRATAQRRKEGALQEQNERRESAWAVTQQATALLKERFGVTEVWLFGSLAHSGWFSVASDIDLAVRGLDRADLFLAVARLQELSSHFSIDLVDLAHCSGELRTAIEKEGVRL